MTVTILNQYGWSFEPTLVDADHPLPPPRTPGLQTRPTAQHERALHAERMRPLSARGPAPADTPDWIGTYLRWLTVLDQQGTGLCTGFETIGSGEAQEIRQGQLPPVPLSPQSPYWNWREENGQLDVDRGAYIPGMLDVARRKGICARVLWPLSQLDQFMWWMQPPSAAAVADALLRKIDYDIISFDGFSLDEDELGWALYDGFAVPFGQGIHAMRLHARKGGYYYGINSHGDQGLANNFGIIVCQIAWLRTGFDFCRVKSITLAPAPNVNPPPPPSPTGNHMALLEIDAARAALVEGTITQPQIDRGKAAWAALVPDGVAPPTGVTYLTPGGSAVKDKRGLEWMLANDDRGPRYGHTLLCNGRPLAASPEVANVGGDIKIRLEAGKPKWQVFIGNDAFDNRWADTTAPT